MALTAKQRATLLHLSVAMATRTDPWLSTAALGQRIYADNEGNYPYVRSFAKIGNDRCRELLKAGLVERKFVGYLGAFKYRLTEAGTTALRERT